MLPDEELIKIQATKYAIQRAQEIIEAADVSCICVSQVFFGSFFGALINKWLAVLHAIRKQVAELVWTLFLYTQLLQWCALVLAICAACSDCSSTFKHAAFNLDRQLLKHISTLTACNSWKLEGGTSR